MELTDHIEGILLESWHVLGDASFYLLVGFGIAGLLHVILPDDKVMKYLGRSAGRVRPVLNASVLGVPLPLCSCGVIPAAISLKKRGATRGATLSFLISTPQTGVDSIAITYALLDPIMTVFRPVATTVTAIVAGLMENVVEPLTSAGKKKTQQLESSCCAGQGCADNKLTSSVLTMMPLEGEGGDSCCESSCCGSAGKGSRLLNGLKYAYVDLMGDIALWLAIGILLAGLISYAMPAELISTYLGGGVMSMILALVVGIPLYICATASTPLAAVLIAKGMSPGAAFVFLLAGPATNVATITMVLKFLGKRSVIVYLGSIAICALLFGLLLDLIYGLLGVDASSIVGSAGALMPDNARDIFALILLPLMIYGFLRKKYLQKRC